jgi:hypothetical protein
MNDNVVPNKDSTLVFHEKVALESSSRISDLNGKVIHELSQDGLPSEVARSGQESKKGDSKHLELEGKDRSSFEDDDAFSFQAGRQNINFPKVRTLSMVIWLCAQKKSSAFLGKNTDT